MDEIKKASKLAIKYHKNQISHFSRTIFLIKNSPTNGINKNNSWNIGYPNIFAKLAKLNPQNISSE